MKKREVWIGLFWAFMGLGIALQSLEYQIGNLRHPGPGFLPFWSGILILLLSILSVIISLKKAIQPKPFFEYEGSIQRMLITFLSLIGYIFIVGRLGFFISTMLFMIVLLKVNRPQSWIKVLTFSILVSFFAYLLFQIWLKVQLPKGWFGF